jgi:hypothetical protein
MYRCLSSNPYYCAASLLGARAYLKASNGIAQQLHSAKQLPLLQLLLLLLPVLSKTIFLTYSAILRGHHLHLCLLLLLLFVAILTLQAMEGVYSQAVGDNILQSIRYEAVARYQVIIAPLPMLRVVTYASIAGLLKSLTLYMHCSVYHGPS